MALLDDAGVPSDGGAEAGAEAGTDAGRPATCEEACKRLNEWSSVISCAFTTLNENGKTVDAVLCKTYPMCEGRRPEGLRSHAEGCDFAAASHLEAASVFAFAHLARELRHYHAPKKLLRAARRSRRDEIRHARMTRALARRPVLRVEVQPMAVRDLEAIALENAIEGCVRETYGALAAWWRATHAPDRDVRDAYRKIARDETKHSALAWELDRWLSPRLSADARRRVEAARIAAFEELRADLALSHGDGPPIEIALATLRSIIGA
jgi:hypothetical protein